MACEGGGEAVAGALGGGFVRGGAVGRPGGARVAGRAVGREEDDVGLEEKYRLVEGRTHESVMLEWIARALSLAPATALQQTEVATYPHAAIGQERVAGSAVEDVHPVNRCRWLRRRRLSSRRRSRLPGLPLARRERDPTLLQRLWLVVPRGERVGREGRIVLCGVLPGPRVEVAVEAGVEGGVREARA